MAAAAFRRSGINDRSCSKRPMTSLAQAHRSRQGAQFRFNCPPKAGRANNEAIRPRARGRRRSMDGVLYVSVERSSDNPRLPIRAAWLSAAAPPNCAGGSLVLGAVIPISMGEIAAGPALGVAPSCHAHQQSGMCLSPPHFFGLIFEERAEFRGDER